MKKIIILIPFLCSFLTTARAQVYDGYALDMALWRQPNARAEAMGRGNAALTGDVFSSFYNPAASSFINGAAVSYSSLDPGSWISNEISYDYMGAVYNTNKYGAIGLSYLNYDWGNFYHIDIFESFTRLYVLNYSYMVMEDFSAGINLNYYKDKITPSNIYNAFVIDIGFLKRFVIEPDKNNIYASISWNNVLNPAIEFNTKDYLPSILHAAGAYEFFYNPAKTDLTPFSVIVCAEYQDVLNGKSYTRFQAGAEVSFLEILKARAGYYAMEFNAGTPDSYYYDKATYGFGINIPFNKIMKDIPLQLSVDYANLPGYYFSSEMESRIQDYNVLTADLRLIL